MIDRRFPWRVLGVCSLSGLPLCLAVACGDDAATSSSSTDASSADGASADAPTTDAPTSGAPDLDAFCKGTLGLFSPAYVACCDANVAPKRYAFDKTLLDSLLIACTSTLGKSVSTGRATFVATAAATCETNVKAAADGRACSDVLHGKNEPSSSIFNGAAGCSGVLTGRQAAGAPCANDYECTDGLTCIGWTSTSDGTCTTPPGDGADCAYALPDSGGFIELVHWGFGTHPRCAPGFYCAVAALQQGTCKPSKSAEAECNSADECADGLRCQAGICTTAGPGPANAPCKRTSDCQDPLYCKSGDGGSVCAPREVAGTPCKNTFGSECQGACVQPDGGEASCVSYCGSL